MTLDFCAIVEPLAPKCSAISVDDVFSRELLLNMKLMLQMVYTEAAAQISTLPDCSGQERYVPISAQVLYTVQRTHHPSALCKMR